MTDDVKTPEPKAPAANTDPMAKARAVKAAKALEKAAAELAQAEESGASRAQGQPVVSKMKGRHVHSYSGAMVRVRITHWGHGEVSTGGLDGFESFASGAECELEEPSARSLFNKRWIEPIDPAYAQKWLKQNRNELLAAMRAKANITLRLESGVEQGENWRSSMEGGELGFNPTERDLKDIGVG